MSASPSFPLTLTDARGESVTLETPPQRIVSLVPSQTELLAYLGLEDEVVGLTRFCVRPEGWKEKKEIVGGTKNVNVERVRALQPDFVLANHEENTRPVVETLAEEVPTYVTSVAMLLEALAMIRTVGRLVGRPGPAERLSDEIARRFAALPSFEPLQTAYLIWCEPYMTVGRDTFIHDMMERAGFVNVFGKETRYPIVTPKEIAATDPDVVLLPDEPFPFDEEYAEELRAKLPGPRLELVDGQPFSWYGSRLLDAPAYLRDLRARLAVLIQD